MSSVIVLQLSNQSLVARLAAFHADPSLNLFPEGLGQQATELLTGNVTGIHNRKGRHLLRLDDVTATPAEIDAWCSSSPVLRNCSRVFVFDASRPPAQSLEDVVAALVKRGAPCGAIRLQCEPRSLQPQLGQLLPLDFVLDPRDFAHVLHVMELDAGPEVRYMYHLAPAQHFWKLAPDVQQWHNGCSRAYLKIEEAFAALRLADLAAGTAAIDLGAAPGGWTEFLAQQGFHILAVDPADMEPAVEAHPHVTHIRSTSQLADAAVEEQLKWHGGTAQLLLSDMNQHPKQVAAAMQPLLRHLRPGGWVIMTLKLPGLGRDRSHWLTKLPDLLQCSFSSARLLWLCANTDHETTFCARLQEI